MNETLPYAINPWNSIGGSVSARDLRYLDPTEKLIYSCQQADHPRTQVFLDGYSYNTLSYNYGIDSLLNLTLTKKILLKMDASMLVYSSLSFESRSTKIA